MIVILIKNSTLDPFRENSNGTSKSIVSRVIKNLPVATVVVTNSVSKT